MPENLFNTAHKSTNPAYRDGYDRTFNNKPANEGNSRAKGVAKDDTKANTEPPSGKTVSKVEGK